jgi:large subunit ribosomal protein L1
MAKKQAAEAAPETKPEGGEAAAKPEGKKPKAKPPAADKAEKGDKAAPAAPAPAAPAAAAAGAAPAAPGAPGASKKDKGRPGVPPRRGKKLRNHIKNLHQRLAKEGAVALPKALNTLKSIKRSKFDETVEIHMNLGVDTTQSDQLVRGTVPLPHGIGKSVRVLVFCQGDNIAKAKEAGADHAGGDEIIEKIQKQGWTEFDIALATQDMMGKVSRLGKVLGPRGLMPTPKAGTVITSDIAAAVREFKAGKVEYRTDKGGNVHAGVGKLSFDEAKLVDNINAFLDAIRHAKPTGVKGHYIKSVTVKSTMSPGIAIAVS